MKKIVVWVCNGVIALLAIFSVVCYFLAPVWTVKVRYPLSGEQLKEMIGSAVEEYDIEDAIQDGIEVNVSLVIGTDLLFESIGSSAESTAEKLVDGNVENVVNQLSGPITEISRKVVQAVAKQVVKDKVNEQVKEFLQNSGSILDDEKISEKLSEAGIDKDYINEKTEELFDAIFDEEVDVQKVGEMIADTVQDAYEKLAQSGDSDFTGAELTDEDRDAIKRSVSEALEKFSEEDGSINPDDLIDRFLLDFLKGQNNGSGDAGISPCAVSETSDTRSELIEEVRTFLMDKIPPEVNGILVWVLRAVLLLFVLSSLAWIFVLIKIIVKFAVAKEDYTVKLKLPIWLGWLPFLVLVLIPAAAFPLLKNSGIFAGETLAAINAASVSFGSIGWVPLLAAGICLAISIFYIVLRKIPAKTGRGDEREAQAEAATAATEDED